MEHIIDAKGKNLGRVATEAASILIGKNTTDFQRNTAPKVTVTIINASQIGITEKKREQNEYKIYSGYPGGLKTVKLGEMITKKGNGEMLRKVVSGMLPKNKLRSKMINNLKVIE